MTKRHSYKDRLKYMKMLEKGYSINFIHEQYGIDHSLMVYLWTRYQSEGASALVKKKNCRLTVDEKLKVISDHREKHLSLPDIMLKYEVSDTAVKRWCREYEKGGRDALSGKPGRRPRRDMGRPKKKKLEEMTELERLRYENERLRAENALLKKVKALVEEREARLKGTGRKPSKD